MLHAKKNGISSGRLGLWLLCAFTFTHLASSITRVLLLVLHTSSLTSDSHNRNYRGLYRDFSYLYLGHKNSKKYTWYYLSFSPCFIHDVFLAYIWLPRFGRSARFQRTLILLFFLAYIWLPRFGRSARFQRTLILLFFLAYIWLPGFGRFGAIPESFSSAVLQFNSIQFNSILLFTLYKIFTLYIVR